MFWIFPFSHDSMTARRWPWVTIAIIVLNLIVHVALLLTPEGTEVQDAAREAIVFHREHPKLEAKPPLDSIERELGLKLPPPKPGRVGQPDDEDPSTLAADQEKLDELTREIDAALAKTPFYTLGYVPTRASPIGLVTHQFVHAGWLHLIFNMWFLWLVGCYVEDTWGRLVFPGFYLAAGAAAGLAHHLSAAGSAVPLIGASGAVAGVMGAFLVKYARTRIRFWYFVWLILRLYTGTFSAAAAVVLPFWLASQLAWGLLDSQDGVAYWAHVGGFVFGVLVAFAIRKSGHERELDQTIENQNTVDQDPRLLEAAAQIDRGEVDAALQELARLAAEQPKKVEVHLERLRAAKIKKDERLEERAYADAIRAYAQQIPDTAVELLDEATREGRAGAVAKETRLRIGRHLAASGANERAAIIFSSLYENGGVDSPGLHALIAHGELALRTNDNATAMRLFEMACLAPQPHAELTGYLEQKLRQARGLGPSGAPPPLSSSRVRN